MPGNTEYYRGTVDEYHDRKGYGLIRPDPDQSINGVLLFNRAGLRSRTTPLRPGDRVLFCVNDFQQGGSPSDVHPEFVESGDLEQRVWGRIYKYWPDRGYGFILTNERQEAFFHINFFVDDKVIPAIGLEVTCKLVRTEKGLHAQDLTLADLIPKTGRTDWLAQAILARDAKRYDDAARLYEKGLQDEPPVQLIFSYAAMEKNRNRKQAAMRVYEQGIKKFPNNAKLREDAGTLAASLSDFPTAVRLLEQSLTLCRSTAQGGEKGVLIGLARTHYQIDTLTSLKDSIRCYEDAFHLFGRGSTRLPEADLLRLNVARIRTQHHRGNLCIQFLKAANFAIVRASLEQATEGAEFVVQIDNPELPETYGLSSHLIVRCMFKAEVVVSDLAQIDESIKRWASSGLGDDQVALIVVASLPQNLQTLLSARIEEKRTLLPALYSDSAIEY